MRGVSFLVLIAILGALLTACQTTSFSFTGTFHGTSEDALRGTLNITVTLLQDEMSIGGNYQAPGNTGDTGENAGITAMVSAIGGYGTATAIGTLTPTSPQGLPAIDIHLFLTTDGDLVMELPDTMLYLEREE